MSSNYTVTRAHLKNACDSKNWDLLDKLLEISTKHINDANYYTDTWGEWWGLLLNCVYTDSVDGVRVLLKHGAKKHVGSWGDCIPQTPTEAAADKPAILALLQAETRPTYTRQTDPALPQQESPQDNAVNRQGVIQEATGLLFQTDALIEKNEPNEED